jgi:hypothetical protein
LNNSSVSDVTDILDVVHLLRLKTHDVSETGYVSILEWEVERRPYSLWKELVFFTGPEKILSLSPLSI